jgi:hypothetical protein
MMKLLYALIIISTFSFQARATTCDEFAKSKDVKLLLNFFKIDSATPSVWQGYKISKYDVAVTDLKKYPKCVLIIENAAVNKITTLNQPMQLPNAHFEYYLSNEQSQLGELAAYFTSNGVKNALVWNLDFYPQGYDQFGIPKELGPTMTYWTIVHEGFHLFVQDSGLYQYPHWPDSHGKKSRPAIMTEFENTCYAQPAAVRNTFDTEYQSLTTAMPLAFAQQSTALKSLSKQYLEARKQRRVQLNNIGVTLPSGIRASCDEMEASYELIEGVPDFVAELTLIQMKLLTAQQVADIIKTMYKLKPQWAYYPLGSFKLLILSQTNTNFTSVVNGLASSGDWSKNIDAAFSQWASQ